MSDTGPKPTLDELRERLKYVIIDLKDIDEGLGHLGAPAATIDNKRCPKHNIPWVTYTWGVGHPPTKPGEKWCKKGQK